MNWKNADVLNHIKESSWLKTIIKATAFVLMLTSVKNFFGLDLALQDEHLTSGLRKSKAFYSLSECIDQTSGEKCYPMFKRDLIEDQKCYFSQEDILKYENCLESISPNHSDMSILLNVQSCFYESKTKKNDKATAYSQYLKILRILVIGISIEITFAFGILLLAQHIISKKFQISLNDITVRCNQSEKLLSTSLSKLDNILTHVKGGSMDHAHSQKVAIERSLEGINHGIETLRQEMHNHWKHSYEGCVAATRFIPIHYPPKNYKTESKNFNALRTNQTYVDYKSSSKSNMFHLDSRKKHLSPLPHLILKKADENTYSFDIATEEGRTRWKRYIREQILKDSTDNSVKTCVDPSRIHMNATENALMKECNLAGVNASNKALSMRYEDIKWTDQNSKKFRRIFILGRGWVSSKKLEQEEKEYGSSSFVKIEL